MGDLLSTPSPTNPSDTHTATTMSSSQQIPQSEDPNPQSGSTHPPKSPETQTPAENPSVPAATDDPETLELPKEEISAGGEGDEEDEEAGECGFCLFMKAGGCRDTFIEWEKCVEEGEKNTEDIAEKCFEVTSALKKCMEAHSDYYAPILRAEQAAEEEAAREFEKERKQEKEAKGSDSDSIPAGSEASKTEENSKGSDQN